METWNIALHRNGFSESLCPSSTRRIVPDGNCFFRALSFTLTGSQEYHEVRLLVTTCMIDNSAHPQLSCLIDDDETMNIYIEQLKMQLLGTWATEIEIISSVLLLQTTIYVYGPCGKIKKCKKNMQLIIVKRKQTSIIMNVYISLHFETV